MKVGMLSNRVSEYQRDQWHSFRAIEKACRGLCQGDLEELKEGLESYLRFRQDPGSFSGKVFRYLLPDHLL